MKFHQINQTFRHKMKFYNGSVHFQNFRCSPGTRTVFTQGPRGPGPGWQIFRGGILKFEIEVGYAEEKRLSTREKFKGDLY